MANTQIPILPSPVHPSTNRTQKWGQRFILPPGISFQTVACSVVDSSGNPVPSPDLLLENVLPGLVDAGTNTWEVDFYPRNATPQTYLIRFDFTFNGTSPGGVTLGDYAIVRLECVAVGQTL